MDPAQLDLLPEPARRYLARAIAPGTLLASAVRLRMRGEIKLKGWSPFTATQVIAWDRGFIWNASVRMSGLPVRGFDRLVDGRGAMQWKLLGLIPVMQASGPDITRSAAGRVAAETVWLPSVLLREDVAWSETGLDTARARFTMAGEQAEVDFGTDGEGRLIKGRLRRWGNPGGGAFGYEDFGAIAEGEGTFGGYTIPTRLRAGWYFGASRFLTDGEFFRCTVESAEYR